MFKLKINYINCESVYEYQTEKERNDKLENLIWVWDLEKISENIYSKPTGGFLEVI